MSPFLIIIFIIAYFGLLIFVSFLTTRGQKLNNDTFFLGNKKSPWYIVAYGMIGASLSGVTFISVPGSVALSSFSYMQVVFGYLLGYLVIATVLMPLYYKLDLTSIYTYLEKRFGFWSYKTGAMFFLISRTFGSAARLYIVAIVLQLAVFDYYNIPFSITVLITIFLIWVYTFKGGIKTIVWTDTLQTTFMLAAVGITIYIIAEDLGLGIFSLVQTISDSDYSRIFFFDDINDPKHFIKQFFSGAFIAIVMTGLDQDMMQKNLSCRNIWEAQKNMLSFSVVLVFANLFFLSLGALLYIYSSAHGITIPTKGDELYPMLATQNYLTPVAAFLFIIGLIAAAYSSADSALAALTTSFCVDILYISVKEETVKVKTRKMVHFGMSLLMAGVIIIFEILNNESVINTVFTVAGYTYGPLLGLYAFGLFTKWNVHDKYVPYLCVISPVICFFLSMYSKILLNGYKFGFELLILNGALTFAGLLILRKR